MIVELAVRSSGAVNPELFATAQVQSTRYLQISWPDGLRLPVVGDDLSYESENVYSARVISVEWFVRPEFGDDRSPADGEPANGRGFPEVIITVSA